MTWRKEKLEEFHRVARERFKFWRSGFLDGVRSNSKKTDNKDYLRGYEDGETKYSEAATPFAQEVGYTNDPLDR